MLPGLDGRGALPVVERIRKRLAEPLPEGNPTFTASFGITDSAEADSTEELIQIADAALYASKAAGRDCITVGLPALVFSEQTRNRDESADPDVEPVTARRIPLHQAAAEEEPAPNGADIR